MHKHDAKQNSQSVRPAYEEIAARAYSFFEAAGRLDGHDVEHWLMAEKQLSDKRPLGNKVQQSARTDRQTKYDAREKTFAADAPRSKREDRYAQASAGR